MLHLQQQIDELETRRKRLLEVYSKACNEQRDNPLLPESHHQEIYERIKAIENRIKELCLERDQLQEEEKKVAAAGLTPLSFPNREDETNPLIVEDDNIVSTGDQDIHKNVRKEKKYYSSFLLGQKSAGRGREITPDMMEKINRFAINTLSPEEVYARKLLMCNSAIDRDNERFPEELLDQFATTLPGKSFLFGHDRGQFYPLGLFFDASTEKMSVDAFKTLTGEDPRLPEGTATVKVVWGWMYMLKDQRQAEAANIDAGVYRHVSISFRAADIRPVKKDVNGPTLYWEYVGPGEATEGSLVWLGAQPGATVQKAGGTGNKSNGGGVVSVHINPLIVEDDVSANAEED